MIDRSHFIMGTSVLPLRRIEQEDKKEQRATFKSWINFLIGIGLTASQAGFPPIYTPPPNS